MARIIKTCIAAATIALSFVATSQAAGVWSFVDNNNEHVQYVDGNQQIFMLGCAKNIAVDARYPDQSKKSGPADVQLSNGKTTLKFSGDLEQSDQGTVMVGAVVDDDTQIIAMLMAGLPITVSTAAGNYVLPAPTIPDLQTRFNNAC